MGLVDWRIVVAVGTLALLVAVVGLRGRKADALPRCKRRRCRYDLSAFIGEVKPGEGYPVTCPECGRAAQGEREVKWGRRTARRRVAWFGAVVLVLSAMVGGVEVYARATNANTLAWMPLWLLTERAEHDSAQNLYIHRAELLQRAQANEIRGNAATRLLNRILDWQTNQTIAWGGLGDIFAHLAMNGHATQEQVDTFWGGAWRVHVDLPEAVAEDSAIPFSIHTEWRGMSDDWVYRHMRTRRPSNSSQFIQASNWMFMHEIRSTMRRFKVEIDGTEVEQEFRGPSRARPGFAIQAPPFPIMIPSPGLYRTAGRAALASKFVGGEWKVESLVGDVRPLPLVLRHGKREGDSVTVRVVAAMVSGLPTPDATMSWSSTQIPRTGAASIWQFDRTATLRITAPENNLQSMDSEALSQWLAVNVGISAHLSRSLHPVVIQKKPGAPPPPTQGMKIPIEIFIRHQFGRESEVREWLLTEFVITDDWTESKCSVRWPHFGNVNRGDPPRHITLRGYRDLVTVEPDYSYWEGEVSLRMPIVRDR